MGFRRTVVRHRTEGGTIVRKVVRHGRDITSADLLDSPVIVFENQETGDIELISRSLVVEIFVEEENPRYQTFRRLT